MKFLYIVFLSIVLSSNAFASGYLVPLGQGVTIQKVHAHGEGGVTLWVGSSEIQNPDSCDRLDKVHIKPTEPGYQTMLTVAMTAYASNKKVGFWSPNCAIIPFWGGTKTFPIVNNLWITE